MYGMITLGIALGSGIAAFLLAFLGASFGVGWSVFSGLAVMLTVQGLLSYRFMRLIKGDMKAVEGIMNETKRAINAKIAKWQFRPPGSMQEAQKILEADMAAGVRAALKATARLDKYRHWVLFVERQAATARLQLSWIIKDFKAVDKYMPKALLLDPASLSMKMARMYMTEAPTAEIEKVYRKAVARARYNGNVLPAACMSWIYLKRGDDNAAFKVLGEALKKSDNAVLKTNHEHLMNNRPSHFSNTNLGDQWFALHLEEPKMRAQRSRVMR